MPDAMPDNAAMPDKPEMTAPSPFGAESFGHGQEDGK